MGFKGRENAYRCDTCRKDTVTIDVDEGVTPMMLHCRADGSEYPFNCPGLAMSMMYPEGPRPEHVPPPAWEWYRPTDQYLRRLKRKDPATADHVERGGLLLRRRQP